MAEGAVYSYDRFEQDEVREARVACNSKRRLNTVSSCSSNELSWSVGLIQTILQPGVPDSSTNFNAIPIICRREVPPGAGRVQQFGENDGSVQGQVVHATSA